MKNIIVLGLIAAIAGSCVGTKKLVSIPVDMMVIHNYAVNENVSLPDSINYFLLTKEDEFDKLFFMTKSSPGNAFVPDFSKQWVVAILLPPSKKVISLQLNAAQIIDKTLHVNYSITDTTSWNTYAHTAALIGVLEKNTDIKKVSFYRDTKEERSISVVN